VGVSVELMAGDGNPDLIDGAVSLDAGSEGWGWSPSGFALLPLLDSFDGGMDGIRT